MKNKALEAPAHLVIHKVKALKCESKGQSQPAGSRCAESPLLGNICWANFEITHQFERVECILLFFYLEVPAIVLVEGLEKLIGLRDVCNHLDLFCQIPERKYEAISKKECRQRLMRKSE